MSLYIVGTPIGNLEDITYRAIRYLKNCDIILCEDTRNSIKLLNHYEIKKRLVSFHKYNTVSRIPEVMDWIMEGLNIALISDAGMPCISDPGQELVSVARENNITVEIIPGPTAFVTAFCGSGIISNEFSFIGFLPKKNGHRLKLLEKLKDHSMPLIFYESPHHLLKCLEELRDVMGENRSIYLCKELTKLYEDYKHFKLGEACRYYEENSIKGEFVLILEPSFEDSSKEYENIGLREHLELYLNKGISKKEAIKLIAKDRNMNKRDVYKELI